MEYLVIKMSSRKRPREQEPSKEQERNSESESRESESESESTASDLDLHLHSERLEAFGKAKITKKNYLEGKARQAHNVSAEVRASFEESQPGPSQEYHSEPSQWNDDVCKCCAPVLQKYSDVFKGMKMQGTELKKRKKINPHPKKPHFDHYLKKQNDWLRSNVFDTMGNYLFCCKCVHTALGVSYKRLAHQRSVKRAEYSEPLRTLTK